MSRKWKLLTALGVFVFAVVVARLIAPIYLLGYVNRTLDGLDGYSGRVGDVGISLWRGAYVIEDVQILKDGPKKPLPFVSAERIDISVHWDALLEGSIVGEIELLEPKLNFLAEKRAESKQEDQREKREAKRASVGESSWQEQVKELVPLKINRIAISRGEIHYRDLHSEPKVDVFIKNLRGHLNNLTNSQDISESMVATASFRGTALGSGELSLDGKVDPYEKQPTFSLDAKLEELEMRELNDFLKAYANVDAEAGRISVYTEIKCEKGRFQGYVKPLIRDLKLLSWKEEEEGVFGKLWEGLVAAASTVFENQKKEQVATRVPFSGKLESPEADIGTTVLYVLRNAFIRALSAGLEGEIEAKGGLAKRDDGD